MNLFTLFNGACSDQIAFCWRTRMAWNALAISRVRWKLWRMMQNQSSLALRLFLTQKSWSRTNLACKAATLISTKTDAARRPLFGRYRNQSIHRVGSWEVLA